MAGRGMLASYQHTSALDCGLVQIVDDLIENNADYGIKGVCFDTFDTLFDIATDEVMRESRRETGKSCKSINDAFGGYNRGSSAITRVYVQTDP